MNHLTKLLERLNSAESAYATSKSSLDNSLEYIVTKEELKLARFSYDKACAKFVKDLLSNDEFMAEAARFINVEEY
jgi:hypothetical protein